MESVESCSLRREVDEAEGFADDCDTGGLRRRSEGTPEDDRELIEVDAEKDRAAELRRGVVGLSRSTTFLLGEEWGEADCLSDGSVG
jgi:hypothetical protein